MAQQHSFDTRKRQILEQIQNQDEDKSPKGSIDVQAWPILRAINDHDDYVSTSSCSGRIAIFQEAPLQRAVKQPSSLEDATETVEKEENTNTNTNQTGWLYCSHEIPLATEQECTQILESTFCCSECTGMPDPETSFGCTAFVSFKMEPFILHAEARTQEAAQKLLQIAMHAGYRNSGLMLGRQHQRHLVAIRSTLKMDVPVGRLCVPHGKLVWMVDREYLRLLFAIAREKMLQNEQRRNHLLHCFEEAQRDKVASSLQSLSWESKEARRERKRKEGLERQQQLLSGGSSAQISRQEEKQEEQEER